MANLSETKKGPIYDPGFCRCCGEIKKCRLLNVEYDHKGQKEIYSDLFVDCFGLLLSQLDGDPKERLICAMCVSRLREANSFRIQVLKCEERLLTLRLNDCHNVKLDIKEEIIESPPEDDVVLDENYDIEPEIPVKKKKSIKKKRHKDNKEDDGKDIDILRIEQLQYAASPTEKETKSQDYEKLIGNIVTIVENSYVCPFDTSFSDYFCMYCRAVFTNPNKLREHTLTHNPNTFKEIVTNYSVNKKFQIDIDRIDCRLCPEVINDIDVFKSHVTSHGKQIHNVDDDFLKFKLNLDKLCCLECGKSFRFFHALKKHMAEHFGNCICDVCGAHYFEKRMLILHQKTHKRIDEVFNCKECGKNFKSKYTRYIHIARTHKNESAYQCRKCDEVFFSYTLRYRHMIDYHGEERLFKCDQCDRSYDSRKSLREHIRRSHLKILRHACMMCDKMFYLPSRLKEHVMTTHTGERNFRCEFCGKSYPRLRGLKVHVQSAHGTEKKHKCLLCSAAFTKNFYLKSHVKRQHGGLDADSAPFLTPVS